MLLYLITYDISCNKRRRRVSDLLEGYGTRVQHSVFECVLPFKKYKELKRRLMPMVNPKHDSLRLYPLSAHTLGTIEAWGGKPLTQQPTSVIA